MGKKKPKPPKEKKPKKPKKKDNEEREGNIMAFTRVGLPTSKYEFFTYYATGVGDDMDQDLVLSTATQLHEIRIHLSSGHASVEDFIALLSTASVSVYNCTLFSKAMNGVVDWVWHPSDGVPMYFNYGDTLTFSMIMSAANVFGITVQGWAITG